MSYDFENVTNFFSNYFVLNTFRMYVELLMKPMEELDEESLEQIIALRSRHFKGKGMLDHFFAYCIHIKNLYPDDWIHMLSPEDKFDSANQIFEIMVDFFNSKPFELKKFLGKYQKVDIRKIKNNILTAEDLMNMIIAAFSQPELQES